MVKHGATDRARGRACCPSVLASPLDAAEAAELARGSRALADPVRLRVLSMLAAVTRWRGLRLRLRRAARQEPAHHLPPPQDPERSRAGPRRSAGQVGVVLPRSRPPRRPPGRHRHLIGVRRAGTAHGGAVTVPDVNVIEQGSSHWTSTGVHSSSGDSSRGTVQHGI